MFPCAVSAAASFQEEAVNSPVSLRPRCPFALPLSRVQHGVALAAMLAVTVPLASPVRAQTLREDMANAEEAVRLTHQSLSLLTQWTSRRPAALVPAFVSSPNASRVTAFIAGSAGTSGAYLLGPITNAATTYTYKGGGSTTTPTSGNFSGSNFTASLGATATSTPVSTNTDTLVFNGVSYSSYIATDDFTSAVNLQTLTIVGTTTASVTLARGTGSALNQLAFSNTTSNAINLNNSGTAFVALDLSLSGPTTFSSNGSATISGVISGSGSLQISGFLTLTGANTYTGGTTVSSYLMVGVSGATTTTASLGMGNVMLTGGNLVYYAGSSAGNTITNNSSSNATGISFYDTSTAGSSNIINNYKNAIQFYNTSTAANSTITNNSNNAYTYFTFASTAGSSTINNSGNVSFYHTSTAGTSHINDNSSGGTTYFYNTSTAGSSTITFNNNGGVLFYDTSTAGGSNITNNSHGEVQFYNTSTAGSSTITQNSSGGGISFLNTSTAGTSNITTNNGGQVNFSDTSTAGTSNIINNSNGKVSFISTSSAGSSSILNVGTIYFFGTPTANNATIVNYSGGSIDISGLASGTGLSMGALSGAGAVFLSSRILTVGGLSTNIAISGVIQDGGFYGGTGGNLTKIGTGTLTLSGANTYTGATTINTGTLALTGSLSSSGGLIVGGGTFSLLGSSTAATSQTVNGFTVAAGGSGVSVTSGTNKNATLALGVIGRVSSGAANFSLTNTGTGGAAITTSTTNNSAGILGGYATFGNTNWAVVTSSNIGAFSIYDFDFASAGSTSNENITTTDTYSGVSVSTLRFNTAAVSGVNINGTSLTLSSGGILETPAVGNNTATISGNPLTSADSRYNLFVTQNNTSAGMIISSVIANNGANAVSLVKSGSGILTLSGANTYTGGTFLNSGIVTVSADTGLGAIPGSATTNLTFSGGTLQFGGAFTLSSNRSITLNSGGGTFDTNGNAIGYGGVVSGSGGLTKTGNGTLTLSAANTYTGGTTVSAGTVAGSGGTISGTSLTNGALGTGTVTVSSGATLSVGQAINTALSNRPGYGTLALSALNLTGGSTTPLLTFDLGATGSTDGSTNDLLKFSGSANNLVFSGSGTYAVGVASESGSSITGSPSYLLMSFATPVAVGSATVANPNTKFSAVGVGNLGTPQGGTFSWATSGGNITGLQYGFTRADVTPEPGTLPLAALVGAPVMAGAIWRGRRRRG